MKSLTRKAVPAALGIALGSVAASSALAEGWYIGAGAGVSSMDNFDTSAGELEGLFGAFGVDTDINSVDSDDSDTGLKIFGGYEVNEFFALEAFYTDLGEFTVNFAGTIDGGEGAEPFTAELGVETTGFGVLAVIDYPLGANFSILGKVGGISWDSDVNFSIVNDGPSGASSAGDDGTDFAWGGGLRYQVTEQLAIDVQYESFDVLETTDLISANVSWSL